MRHHRLWVLSSLAFLLSVPLGCQADASTIQEHLARGEQHENAGRLTEAQIEQRSALQTHPNHAAPHSKPSHAYLRGRKVREGFWELRETVRLDATNYTAKLEFAQLAILAGELDEALKQSDLVVAG